MGLLRAAAELEPETIISGIGVAWSLSVEVAFYVLLPFYAAAVARLVRRRDRDGQARLELVLLGASAVLAVVVRGLVHALWPESVFGNQLPGTWTWFAGGLALAVASAWLRAAAGGGAPVAGALRDRAPARRAGGSRSRS